MTHVLKVFLAGCAALQAQTFTTLHGFSGGDGAHPHTALIQASDGNLYGTAEKGGIDGAGIVYRITADGSLTVLHRFCSQPGCQDGANPRGALVQANSGELYGTTYSRGIGQSGTVFKMTLDGALTTLYAFCTEPGCPDGQYPFTPLIQAKDGDLYGGNFWGPENGWGTIFKITLAGDLTTLYAFCRYNGACPIGANPEGLVQASGGALYGTNFIGGPQGGGTLFLLTAPGTVTNLHSFGNPQELGIDPNGGLIIASDHSMYGTSGGGSALSGMVFRFSSPGVFSVFYSFCSQPRCSDGSSPRAGLIQAADGNFYGTTAGGGAHNSGTVFQLTPGGQLTTLYSFCSQPGCADGGQPQAALLQGHDGALYGTTFLGGDAGLGTIFKLSLDPVDR